MGNVKHWLGEIDKYAKEGVNKVLVGNKCDLSSKKVVSYDEAKELAEEFSIPFMEASAKNSHNVDEAFKAMANDMKQRFSSQQQQATGVRGGPAVLPTRPVLVQRD